MANPVKAGSGYLVGGMDSYTLPTALTDREYVAAMNVCCRGGIVQTRPGTKSLVQVMRDAVRVQGFAAFTPTGGIPHLVAAVDGSIFVSALPFTSVRQLTNLRFNPTSRFVAFETCLKSTEFDEAGGLYFLDHPYNVLMIQDGATRAAYWDGATSRHLNPTPSGRFDSNGDILTIPGFDETFIGLFMKWSGNRLWVSRDGQVFASDFGNPLKFTEAQYINEGRSFYLTGECTGMIETPDQSGLIIFTADNGTLFKTSIQDRTLWLSTVDFNKVIFPDIGCVAPFSPIRQYGLIWWFSAQGLINSDQAMATYRTSRIDYKDSEMMCSKGNLGPDLGGVCTAAFENYLLVSVPSGDTRNRHTWCLDQAVLEDGANAWDSYWTGWHPVQWATARMNGHERVFFISKDDAGCVKIWEANQPDRTDNGAPITCFVQTKSHAFESLDIEKRFVYAEVLAREILGDVSMMIGVGGVKGAFYRATTKEIVATKGAVFASSIYDLTTCMYGNKPQTRTIRTNEDAAPGFCNTCGVESDQPNNIDREFGLLIVWSGRMGITGYGMTAVPFEIPNSGTCEANEEGFRSLSEQGCSSMQQYITGCAFEEYNGAAVVSVYCPRTKQNITASASATSIISEADAIRKATASAQIEADRICNCETFVYVNALQRFTAFCEGVAGISKTVIIQPGLYTSTVSQAAADALAYDAARAQALAEIECPEPPPETCFVAPEDPAPENTGVAFGFGNDDFADATWQVGQPLGGPSMDLERYVMSDDGRLIFAGNPGQFYILIKDDTDTGFSLAAINTTGLTNFNGPNGLIKQIGRNGVIIGRANTFAISVLWADGYQNPPTTLAEPDLFTRLTPDGKFVFGWNSSDELVRREVATGTEEIIATGGNFYFVCCNFCGTRVIANSVTDPDEKAALYIRGDDGVWVEQPGYLVATDLTGDEEYPDIFDMDGDGRFVSGGSSYGYDKAYIWDMDAEPVGGLRQAAALADPDPVYGVSYDATLFSSDGSVLTGSTNFGFFVYWLASENFAVCHSMQNLFFTQCENGPSLVSDPDPFIPYAALSYNSFILNTGVAQVSAYGNHWAVLAEKNQTISGSKPQSLLYCVPTPVVVIPD